MPPTTSYSFGDLVLVPFPFTDQSAAKRRPAVVISSRAYHQERPDLIIMAVTSQVKPTQTVGEVVVQDWQAAGLLKPSAIKPVLTTIEASPCSSGSGSSSKKTRPRSSRRSPPSSVKTTPPAASAGSGGVSSL